MGALPVDSGAGGEGSGPVLAPRIGDEKEENKEQASQVKPDRGLRTSGKSAANKEGNTSWVSKRWSWGGGKARTAFGPECSSARYWTRRTPRLSDPAHAESTATRGNQGMEIKRGRSEYSREFR